MGKVAKLERQIEELKQEIEDTKANHFFTCPNCEKKTKVNKTTLVSRQHYVEPYSCSGGDYWTFDEWVVVCPKCDNGIRVYDKKSDLYTFVQEHEFNFKEKLPWYARRTSFLEGTPTFNVEELRKKNAERRRRW